MMSTWFWSSSKWPRSTESIWTSHSLTMPQPWADFFPYFSDFFFFSSVTVRGEVIYSHESDWFFKPWSLGTNYTLVCVYGNSLISTSSSQPMVPPLHAWTLVVLTAPWSSLVCCFFKFKFGMFSSLILFFSFSVSDQVAECNSLRVPKIRSIFGVVGMLKLLAGHISKLSKCEWRYGTITKIILLFNIRIILGRCDRERICRVLSGPSYLQN